MKYKSALIAQGSGSLGGMTFSHNRGGQYIRNRSIPTNPNTSAQNLVRNFMRTLTNAWTSILTEAQRTAWTQWADNTPTRDPLGEPRKMTGLNAYIRGNVARLLATLTRVDDAPSEYNLGEFTHPTITSVTASTDVAVVAFTNTDSWAGETGSAMLIFCGVPQGRGIQFFKGPYKFATKIAGNNTTPPTSPVNVTLPFNFAVGQKCFLSVTVTRKDGRYSDPFQVVALAA